MLLIFEQFLMLYYIVTYSHIQVRAHIHAISAPGKACMLNCPSLAPPVVSQYCVPELVDRKCQVRSPVALVDLAVRSFPWFLFKLAKIRARIP